MVQTKRSEWAILASPLIIFLLIFLGFPALVNIVYSVSEVRFETLRSPSLSGFGNYLDVLQDNSFWQATGFSLRFGLLTAFVECCIGLFLAIFLSPLLNKRSSLMAALMLPLMVAPAMVGLMYRLVLHEFVGPIPYYLFQMFGSSPAFLNATTAFWTLSVVEILQWSPFAFLLFHMAYQAVPAEIRGAASVDGATSRQILWFVELPLMIPTIIVAFFVRFIDGFRVFDNVYTLVGSGPGGSTTSLSIYIYESFFKRGNIGEAVAASVVLFIASFAVLWSLTFLGKREAKS